MELTANELVRAAGAEARILWCDATANLSQLSSPSAVAALFDRCRKANINVVVVDVKDIAGRVLYSSRIAPALPRPDGTNFDLLRSSSEEARKHGIALYASINVFSEGRKTEYEEIGPVFEHPDWEAVIYTAEPWVHHGGDSYPVAATGKRALPGRLALFEKPARAGQIGPDETAVYFDPARGTVTSLQAPSGADGEVLLLAEGAAGDWLKRFAGDTELQLSAKPRFLPSLLVRDVHNAVFANPILPDVKNYELSIIQEIARNYDVDGLVLDRMRYAGVDSDFSDASRAAFERWLGQTVANWPRDIIWFGPLSGQEPEFGPLFARWIEWRARVLKDFLIEARTAITAASPHMQTGVYVGSWYWSYYPNGANWASDRFRPKAPWASPEYHEAGFAPEADWITTGCYYPIPTREEARSAGASPGATVEAAAEGSANVIGDAAFTYAGLYLLDYKNHPDKFLEAIDVCRNKTQGVMLFDLIYIEEYGWWDLLARAFPEPAPVPDQMPDLRRKLREAYERSE